MLCMYPEMIPYELLGKITFTLIVLSVGVTLAVIIGFGLFICWNKVWYGISELMWNGHRGENNANPPLWKTRISGVSLAIGRFQFLKLVDVYKESEDIADDE